MKILVIATFGNQKTRARVWWYQLPGDKPKRTPDLGYQMDLKEAKLRIKEMLQLKHLPRGFKISMSEIKEGPEQIPAPQAPVGRNIQLKTQEVFSKKEFKDYEDWKYEANRLGYKQMNDSGDNSSKNAFSAKGNQLRGHFNIEDGDGWLYV
jgi:hypothetical protein